MNSTLQRPDKRSNKQRMSKQSHDQQGLPDRGTDEINVHNGKMKGAVRVADRIEGEEESVDQTEPENWVETSGSEVSGSESDDNEVHDSQVQVATDVIEATDTTGKDEIAVEVSELGREELTG